jgi:hypothetical protein
MAKVGAPGYTGRQSGRPASYRTGLASPPDPRSGGGRREVPAAAWSGASAGGALARRHAAIGVPTRRDCSGRPHGGGCQREPRSDPASSPTPGPSRPVRPEHRATSARSARAPRPDREAKAPGRPAARSGSEASDPVRVPMTPAHTGGHPAAARGAGRAWTTAHASPSHTGPTPRGSGVAQGVAGVRQAGRQPTPEPCTA